MVISTALVTRVGENGKAYLSREKVELGQPQHNQVLVRIHSIAQNPTDVQSLDTNAFGDGAVLGCDFTGTVEAMGNKVSSLKIGDTIAGLVWGGEIKGLGAYSEYVFADEKICFKIPKTTRNNAAATVPLACATAWLALFSKGCLNLQRGTDNPTPVLIWGGSSSVGIYAIQLARIFSIPSVAICSPKHFEHCKSMGADYVFNYRDLDVVDKIKSQVPNIGHVFDCIGEGTSSTQASQAVCADGGLLCTVRPGKANTENVEKRVQVTDVLVWTAFLKDHQYREFKWPASQADHDLSCELFQNIPGWLERGKLKPNTVRVIPGGLDAVKEGFQMHRDGQVSAFKIVYEL
ncbi:hypothetical protein V491_00787 [Pseudogymnoascus sp. VKM F-3775]|nr:hypothetical protein V491_00787 [Pseudogymnoascus sp. VKM F-3775]